MNRKDFDKIYQLAKFAAVQGNVAAKQLGLACHSGYPPSFFGNINFFYDSFPSLLKKLQWIYNCYLVWNLKGGGKEKKVQSPHFNLLLILKDQLFLSFNDSIPNVGLIVLQEKLIHAS